MRHSRRLEVFVIGQNKRYRSVKLAKATQHPLHALFFVFPRYIHHLKKLDRDVDLIATVDLFILFDVGELALHGHPSHRVIGVALANFIQSLSRDSMNLPCLRIERRRCPLCGIYNLIHHAHRQGIVGKSTDTFTRP